MAKNEVAKKDKTTSAVAEFDGYGEFAGKGFQNQTQDDIAIPFINVLQSNSPEIDGEAPVAGAKPGMLINSVTQELYTELVFVPAITQHVFVEWTPRDSGGGLVAQHALHSEVVKDAKAMSTEFGKYKVEDTGNDLVETFYVFGILCAGAEPVGMVLIPFTATKIKAYKAIMGRLNSFQIETKSGRVTPPMFAHSLAITTVKQTNTKGSFYVPVVLPAVENDVEKSLLATTDHRFLMAAECEKLVDSGKAHADTDSVNRENVADADGTDDPF